MEVRRVAERERRAGLRERLLAGAAAAPEREVPGDDGEGDDDHDARDHGWYDPAATALAGARASGDGRKVVVLGVVVLEREGVVGVQRVGALLGLGLGLGLAGPSAGALRRDGWRRVGPRAATPEDPAPGGDVGGELAARGRHRRLGRCGSVGGRPGLRGFRRLLGGGGSRQLDGRPRRSGRPGGGRRRTAIRAVRAVAAVRAVRARGSGSRGRCLRARRCRGRRAHGRTGCVASERDRAEPARAGRLVGPLDLDRLHRAVQLEHASRGLGADAVRGGRETVRVQYLRAAPVCDPDLVQ